MPSPTLHATHVYLAFIWGAVVTGVSGLELYFIGIRTVTSVDIFFIALQNISIALANSYFSSKIKVTTSGMSETTSPAKT